MLTSESDDLQFQSFLMKNMPALEQRLRNAVYGKYRLPIIHATVKKQNIPPVIVSVKVEDITLYACAFGVRFRGPGFEVKGLSTFLIMKDLRKQTRILVIITDDSVIIYNTHAISRYKERLGLDENMDFVDMCKHMVTVGNCGSPKIIGSVGQIHGTNVNHMEIRIICLNGAFIGYYSEETGVCYAETFLSSNEIRDNQAFLDVTRDPAWEKWRENQQLILQGKRRCDQEIDPFVPGTPLALEDGKVKVLTLEEAVDTIEEYEKVREEIPDFDQQQIDNNIRKKERRLKRKGIK